MIGFCACFFLAKKIKQLFGRKKKRSWNPNPPPLRKRKIILPPPHPILPNNDAFFFKATFTPPPGNSTTFLSTLNKSVLFLTLGGKIPGRKKPTKNVAIKKKASSEWITLPKEKWCNPRLIIYDRRVVFCSFFCNQGDEKIFETFSNFLFFKRNKFKLSVSPSFFSPNKRSYTNKSAVISGKETNWRQYNSLDNIFWIFVSREST